MDTVSVSSAVSKSWNYMSSLSRSTRVTKEKFFKALRDACRLDVKAKFEFEYIIFFASSGWKFDEVLPHKEKQHCQDRELGTVVPVAGHSLGLIAKSCCSLAWASHWHEKPWESWWRNNCIVGQPLVTSCQFSNFAGTVFLPRLCHQWCISFKTELCPSI